MATLIQLHLLHRALKARKWQRFTSEQAAAAAASGQSGYPTTLKDLPSFCQLCFCTGGSPNYTKVCYTGGGTGGVELHEFVTR